jgi:hypothetical protein
MKSDKREMDRLISFPFSADFTLASHRNWEWTLSM